MTRFQAMDRAREESKKGYVQHVNRVINSVADYIVSDWYDCDLTVASFENGRQL